MKIHNFRFQNKALEFKIEPIKFSNLSLLVGISGVGKTMILQALLELKKIVKGKALNGIEWEIVFSTNGNNNNIYLWRGAFENTGKIEFLDSEMVDKDVDETVAYRPKLEYEELYLNDNLIAVRKENEIILENKPTPKLSSYKSLLNLFAEVEIISPASESFNKIIKSDDSDPKGFFVMDNFEKILQKHTTIESIRNANMPINIKLALTYKNQLNIFTTIKEHFIDVFPQIEDIKLEPLKTSVPFFMQNIPQLQIKEKEVAKWIFQNRISSGMFKTLMQISEIYLCSEGTVILIDEFENSLGINCIDTLIENLLHDDRHLQFIVTSHHPYIITAIGMEHWKIISRHGGTIITKDAKDFKLGKSRHDAFKQLIQLTDYRRGIKI